MKIDWHCHVRTEIVVTKHSDTQFRKKIRTCRIHKEKIYVYLVKVRTVRTSQEQLAVCVIAYIFEKIQRTVMSIKSIRALQIRWSHQVVHGFQTRRCRHTWDFVRSESEHWRRLLKLYTARKSCVLADALILVLYLLRSTWRLEKPLSKLLEKIFLKKNFKNIIKTFQQHLWIHQKILSKSCPKSKKLPKSFFKLEKNTEKLV